MQLEPCFCPLSFACITDHRLKTITVVMFVML
jgi:hypothetical protein